MGEERETPRNRDGAGFETAAGFLADMAKAQGEALSQVQNWSVAAMAAYRQQAEEYNGLLQAVNRSLEAAEQGQRAMTELADSHMKATKALNDSVDASRDLVSKAVASNRQSLDRLESLVTAMVQQVGSQVAALGDQMPTAESIAAGPFAAQRAAYLEVTRTWMDAFNNVLGGGAAAKGQEADSEEAN
jgi:hypothetical protein